MISIVRAIDHLVVATRDLDAEAEAFVRLGFTVGKRNQHPWGTENRLVVLQGGFLELLGLGADFRAPIIRRPDTEFAAFIGGFLPDRVGLAMLALTSDDAAADARAFAAAGRGDADGFMLERQVTDRPGETVGFSLAFARSRWLDAIGFFTCQHHAAPPPVPSHPNGATRLLGAAIVSDDPADHADFLSGFTGQRAFEASSLGLELPLAERQVLEVLTPLGFAFRFGAPPPFGEPRLAAVRVGVSDSANTRRGLESAGFTVRDTPGGIAVETASGVTMAFEPDPEKALR